MKYSDDKCDITFKGNVLTLSGKMEKADYGDIEVFLSRLDGALAQDVCIIDLTGLTFLNSRGLRMLGKLIMGSSKKFELQIAQNSFWQTQSIPPLAYLRPERISVVSK